jgi:hypothetical protein
MSNSPCLPVDVMLREVLLMAGSFCLAFVARMVGDQLLAGCSSLLVALPMMALLVGLMAGSLVGLELTPDVIGPSSLRTFPRIFL